MTQATLNVIDYYISNDFCRGGNGEDEGQLLEERRLVAAAPDLFVALQSMVINYAQLGRVTENNIRDAARLLQGLGQ